MDDFKKQRSSVRDSGLEAEGPVQGEPVREALLSVLWRRRWILLGAVLLALAGGLVYILKATPTFTSTSRLYVEQSGPKIISDSEGVKGQSSSYLFTQCELLTSTPIISAALEQPEMKQLKTFSGVTNPSVQLKLLLQAEVGKKDDIISVSCDSPYPEEAAQIVNSVVDCYITFNSKLQRSTAAEVLKILQKEKEKRDKEFDAKLNEMLDFRRANGMLSFDKEGNSVVLDRLSKLSQALTEAQLATIDAKASYEAAKAMAGDPVKIRRLMEAQYEKGVYVLGNTQEDRLRSELLVARDQLGQLKQQFSDEFPSVKAAAARVQHLEENLQAEQATSAEAFISVAEQRYDTAKKREAELQTSFDDQQKLAQDANIKTAQFATLQADFSRIEKLCDIIDSRIKEINVTEDAGALNISILEAAKPADKPTKPQRARVMAMALALGLMLGIGIALLREWTDHRLRSAEEIASVLGVPVLGVVPHIAEKLEKASRARLVALDTRSNAAEAYRTVRTAVYFGVPDGQGKTLLVTSPTAGDGKSTLASNLAIAMAQAGQRTLIIDADFRKPVQHSIFELEQEYGLSSVLAGQGSLEKGIRSTSVPGLDVLPCGPIPPNPSEMLNSKNFAEILDSLAQRYDHVIIDSPPVMPVTDARILGAMCSITVLVLRAEKTTRKMAEAAREGLRSTGARILGAVVNDLPIGHGRYGYYSYGYYGYGYGYGRSKKDSDRHGDNSPSGQDLPSLASNKN